MRINLILVSLLLLLVEFLVIVVTLVLKIIQLIGGDGVVEGVRRQVLGADPVLRKLVMGLMLSVLLDLLVRFDYLSGIVSGEH